VRTYPYRFNAVSFWWFDETLSCIIHTDPEIAEIRSNTASMLMVLPHSSMMETRTPNARMILIMTNGALNQADTPDTSVMIIPFLVVF
jgi:hypothetical protein